MTVHLGAEDTSLGEAGERKRCVDVVQAVSAGPSHPPGHALATHQAAVRPRVCTPPPVSAVTSLSQRPRVLDLVYVTSHV